jgi:hypothetical protein
MAEKWYPGVGNDPIDTSGKYVDASGKMQNNASMDLSDLAKLYASQRGKGAIEDIYMENRRYNKMLTDEAYERSLGWDMEGPAGSTSFDKETNEMLAEFSPEMQELYDGWLRAEQRAGEELGAYDMDERTLKQIGMFDAASAERDRQSKLAMDEQIFAQGIGGTQGYYNQMALGEQVNQRRLQEALQARNLAMGERNLLSAEQLAFGNAAIDSPRMLMQQGDLSRAIGQGSHTGVNVPGVSLGSLALADTKAGFWSGLLGGASQYGGGGSGMGGGANQLIKGLLNPYGSSMMTTSEGQLA